MTAYTYPIADYLAGDGPAPIDLRAAVARALADDRSYASTRSHALSPARAAHAQALLRDGATHVEISEALCVRAATVRAYLKMEI